MKLTKFSMLALGAAAAVLGGYGAFEYAAKLEGSTTSYLTLAAPLIAGVAALAPYYAEEAWKARHRLKALIWVITLVPAAATVFFAAAERVHHAKAGAAAERTAIHAAVARAGTALAEAKASAKVATIAADKVRGLTGKWCTDRCQSVLASEAAALKRAGEAEAAVKSVQAKAATEAPLEAPVWLLPLSLDLFAFVAIWTGLAIDPKAVTRKVRRRRKALPKRRPPAGRPTVRPSALHVVGS